MEHSETFWNPYAAGIALGLVLLTSFLVMGHGLGASGAANRAASAVALAVAPAHAASTPSVSALAEGRRGVLDDWLVFEVLGVIFGGLVAAWSAGRLRLNVMRGAGVGIATRLSFAFGGGLLMGLAARAARGCTSGQALSGGAVMSVGAWIFMLSVFAGGYALAWFVRRLWS
ncbi:MAG TPA: YeeE/YedE thiosulfate transporter family protein [Thermoanaerobaculia bacterium]|nr:YeeE/YedE thiosulfate transporter family protein [Thermoanaerobaculia bacterium]